MPPSPSRWCSPCTPPSPWGSGPASAAMPPLRPSPPKAPARFPWMLCRFFAVFVTVSLFAFATTLAAAWVRPGLAWGEMLLLYLPTAFFFASVAALVGGLSPQEHLPTLVCGLLWLVALLARSLLRLPWGGVCLPLPALCRGPARRLSVEQGGAGGDRAAAVGGPWAARGKTAQSGPSPHNPYTQTGESVVYYFYQQAAGWYQLNSWQLRTARDCNRVFFPLFAGGAAALLPANRPRAQPGVPQSFGPCPGRLPAAETRRGFAANHITQQREQKMPPPANRANGGVFHFLSSSCRGNSTHTVSVPP